MDFWSGLRGWLQVELTTADPEGALSSLTKQGLGLHRTERMGELTLRFWVNRRQLELLQTWAARRGDWLRITGRRGLYWQGRGLLRRPVLLGTAALLLGLTLLLPSRVLLIRVEGNTAVPTRRILEAAQDCGIRFWASRRAIRSEQVKNRLLEAIPELSWAGVNTAGAAATISVRERSCQETPVQSAGVCNVVACREGLVTQVTVLAGNSLCRPGQVVQTGELLVSGFTDCGRTIRATRAKAEVYALTRRDFSALFPAQWVKKGRILRTDKKYSLVVGKKRINFGKNSGILGVTCGKMTEQYRLTLPGGFSLPLVLAVETLVFYEPQPMTVSPAQAEASLAAFSRQYLTGIMVAGEILEQKLEPEPLDGAYGLTGSYTCREMIARQQSGEIFETNGKTD